MQSEVTPFRLALVTRLRTPNKGNEGLSSECIRALEADRRVSEVVLLERTPPYMWRFDAAQLRDRAALVRPIQNWTSAALDLERSAEVPLGPLAHQVVLDECDLPKQGLIMSLKRALGLQRRLAKVGWHDSDYGRRLKLIRDCGNVVLNAAGEFWETATDIPIRHLLDLHFAQALGCKTAIINHTFSIRDRRVLELAAHVYPKLDFISVRDEESRNAIAALGLPSERIAIAADLVFLTEPGEYADPAEARIALCPNAVLGHSLEERWSKLIQALLARGLSCCLCSNDFPTDSSLIRHLAARHALPVVGRGLDYRSYSAMLGNYDAVVSSRLHTGILAIVAGTPVVPIEGLTFKITAAMAEIRNPFPAVNFDRGDWIEAALNMVQSAIAGGHARSSTAKVAAAQRALAARSVSELVSALA